MHARALCPSRLVARLAVLAVVGAASGCGPQEAFIEDLEGEPIDDLSNVTQQGLISCASRTDTGYSNGSPFQITVVSADGRPVEVDTAHAYHRMQQAAAAAGIQLRVVSGFRTHAEQKYLYACYVNCNCNGCNLAASPGYSNHQSGHALDLNTSAGGVYNWLANNAHRFGFKRTVPSEPWHWEYWGGPSAGPCSAPPPPPPPANRYEVLTGDFDGDGKTDLATVSPNGGGGWANWIAVELGKGVSTVWPAHTPMHMRNGNSSADYRVLAADFNGDGRTDLLTVSRNGGGGWAEWSALELSTGSGFVSTVWRNHTPLHMRNGGSDRDYRVFAGDFNGDGKADVATLSPNGGGGWANWVALELSTGSGFHSTVWASSTPQHIRNGGGGGYVVLTGDFNGDKKTDLLTVSPNGGGGWAHWHAVDLSTGSGFSSGAWASSTPQHMRNGGPDFYRVLVGDFDGNGMDDVATVSPLGAGGWRDWVAMDLSLGNRFHSTVWPAATPAHMRNGGTGDHRVVAADFNGDGKADLASLTATGGGGWANWVAMELSTGGGFHSTVWPAATPVHMRNGDNKKEYRVLTGDLDGNRRADLLTISPNGLGGWANWFAVEASTGTGFSSGVRGAATPQHIRNGGY